MQDEAKTKELSMTEARMHQNEGAMHTQSLSEVQPSIEDLQKIQRNYRELVEATNSIILRWDRDGRITFLNTFGQKFFGYDAEEILGRNVIGTIVPESDQAGRDLVKMIRDIGARPELYVKNQNENIRRNGERVWISWTNNATFDENGNAVEILSIGNDHTEMKRIEEELRQSKEELETRVAERTADLQQAYERLKTELKARKQSEEALKHNMQMLRSIVATSPVGIALTEDRVITWVNDAWARMFGFEHKHEWLGQNTRTLYPSQAEYERAGKLLFEDLADGRVTETDTIFRRKDGSLFDGHVRLKLLDPSNPRKMTIAAVTDISDRRKAEKALRESEEKYRILVEKALEGILVAQDGLLRFVNAGAEAICGYDAEELTAKPFTEVIHPDDRDMVLQRHIRRLKGEKFPSRYSFRIVRKDGDVRWVEIDSGMIYWEEKPAALFFMTDITERKSTEEALQSSEEKFFKAFHASPDAIIITRAVDGRIVDVNEGFLRLAGYSREDALGNSTVSLKVWADAQDRDKVVAELHHNKSIREQAFNFRNSSGDILSCLYTGEMISLGNEPHVLSVVRDITESKKAEKALRESEKRYRAVLESSPDPIVVYDRAGLVTYVNPAFVDTFGWSQQELVGHRIDFLPEAEVQKTRETLTRLYEGENVPSFDTRRLTKDGRILDIYISAALLKDAAGEPVGNVVTLRDITERKVTENALRASEEGKRILIEGSPIGIGIVQNNTYAYVNQTLVRMMGYESPEEIVGRSPLEFIAPEDRDLVLQRGKARLQGVDTPANYQVKGINKTGESFDVSIWPRRTDYLGRPALLTFVLDVSEENRLKAQLVQAQKMEAVGTLAGGMAHDFNNLLQVILGYSQLLLAGESPGSPEYNHLRKIMSAGRGGAELIKQLLAFSRKASTKPVPLNLNHRVMEVKGLLIRIIPRMIKIELRLKEDLPVIYADSVQMEQILMNLGVNARDAMPDGGTLTIETQEVFLDQGFSRVHVGAREGRHVMLAVSDTGHGMDKEILEHVFEPFYTTKDVGKGTGLGLSMVYGIVKQHHGYISCESRLGHGTTFRIYFPALEKIEEEQERIDVSLPPGGSETLLLVDDEESVIQLESDYLRESGYSVLTASNGREALLLYRERQADISLVILDLIMPEMGGKQCLQELRKINPDVRVLVVSGHTSGGTPSEVAAVGARGFVAKPCDMSDLLSAVREALDAD